MNERDTTVRFCNKIKKVKYTHRSTLHWIYKNVDVVPMITHERMKRSRHRLDSYSGVNEK